MALPYQNPQSTPPAQPTFSLNNPGSWYANPFEKQNDAPHFKLGKAYGYDTKGQNFEAIMRRSLLLSRLPAMFQTSQFTNDFNPLRLQMAGQGARILDPTNNQAKIDRMRKGFISSARNEIDTMIPLLKEQGAGTGAVQGAIANTLNRATEQGNDFASFIQSPEQMMQAYQAAMAMIDAGMTDPSTMMAMSSTPQSFQKTKKEGGGNGFLSTAASLAGSYVGGGGTF